MKQSIIQNKHAYTDGATIAAGGIYASVSDALPLVIGVLTAILLTIRILVTIQEYRKNKRDIDNS
jgi:hypothetical protein